MNVRISVPSSFVMRKFITPGQVFKQHLQTYVALDTSCHRVLHGDVPKSYTCMSLNSISIGKLFHTDGDSMVEIVGTLEVY